MSSNDLLLQGNLQELKARKDALDQKIEQLKKEAKQEAITKATSLIESYDLTPTDLFGKAALFGSPSGASSNRTKVAPKYRHPATGQTWTGRGKPPKWMQDVTDRTQYLIQS